MRTRHISHQVFRKTVFSCYNLQMLKCEIGANDYFYNYMQMRLSQCMILKQIYGDIIKLTNIPPQAYLLSDMIKKISLEYHEINDAVGLLSDMETVQAKLRNEELPTSRKEFEDRAVLYHILMDLELFIALKHQFASNLTAQEKQKYWKSH